MIDCFYVDGHVQDPILQKCVLP